MKNFFQSIPRFTKISALVVFSQIFIVLSCVEAYGFTKPVDVEDCIEKTIVIYDKEVSQKIGSTRYKIYDGEKWYVLATPDSSADYSDEQVYEMLDVGDEIDIIYKAHYSVIPFVSNYNTILDAKDSDNVYLKFRQNYNNSKGWYTVVLVIIAVSEAGWIAMTVALMRWDRNLRIQEREEKDSLIEENNTQA